MSHKITVEGGTSVLLPTAGKYCDRDIVVTATGTGGGSVAEPVIEPLEITENGTYTAPGGVDGYSPVTVNVPIPDGYIVPSGELEVTENGTFDVTDKASVNVNVPTGGGSDDVAGAVVDRTVTEFINDKATKIGDYALRSCTKLTIVDAPNAKSIGQYAFAGCSLLASVNFPKVESVGTYAFNQCNDLRSIAFPSATTVYTNTFRDTQYVEIIDLPKVTNIPATTFYGCRGLKALILRSPTLVTLANTSAFTTCYRILGTKNAGFNPNGEKIGFIYVQRTLADGSDGVATYQAATNWSSSSLVTQIRPIVATAADLASIDGSVYDRAFVEDENCVYIYDGSAWAKEG